MINGFLNVNKPDGLTSFDVITKIRKTFGIKKIGHLGTLDPAGTGVLPLAIGKATKFFDYFLEKTKVYRAIFVFGKETDTLDSMGVLTKRDDKIISEEQVKEALEKFKGEINQVPPMYSAKKINGKRAYDLARQNKDIQLNECKVIVHKFDLIKGKGTNKFLFEIECSSGTYIRSLCRDLARELDSVGYMPLIIRVKSGMFEISDSLDLNTILEKDKLDELVVPIDKLLKFDAINLNEEEYKKVRNGLTIQCNKQDAKYFLYNNSKLFALGNICDKKLKMEIFLDD